jgi:hypothetical protein
LVSNQPTPRNNPENSKIYFSAGSLLSRTKYLVFWKWTDFSEKSAACIIMVCFTMEVKELSESKIHGVMIQNITICAVTVVGDRKYRENQTLSKI